jgi:hypothetical protein
MISADDVAIAIIAACRETGGDPVACASGAGINVGGAKYANQISTCRARHYALHALLHVFPGAEREKVCALVGAMGSPKSFWNNSLNQVIKPAGNRRHVALWWNDKAYDRVIRAVEAGRGNDADGVPLPAATAPEPPPPYRPPAGTVEKVLAASPRPERLGTLDRSGYRPPPDAIRKILDDDEPVFDRGSFSERKARDPVPRGKADLARELREAAANTARMQGER